MFIYIEWMRTYFRFTLCWFGNHSVLCQSFYVKETKQSFIDIWRFAQKSKWDINNICVCIKKRGADLKRVNGKDRNEPKKRKKNQQQNNTETAHLKIYVLSFFFLFWFFLRHTFSHMVSFWFGWSAARTFFPWHIFPGTSTDSLVQRNNHNNNTHICRFHRHHPVF